MDKRIEFQGTFTEQEKQMVFNQIYEDKRKDIDRDFVFLNDELKRAIVVRSMEEEIIVSKVNYLVN